MSVVQNNAEAIEYRVVLLDPCSPAVLAVTTPEGFCLPRVRIPKWKRPAEEINKALRRESGITTVVLAILEEIDQKPSCAVVELLSSAVSPTVIGLTPCQLETLRDSELDFSERVSIQDVITGEASCPFSRRGWITEVQAWIRESIHRKDLKFTSTIRQLTAGSGFALVRFATESGPAYWLKATGEPNKHEAGVTATLSRLFPEHLPTLVGVRSDWNAWVSQEDGLPICDNPTLAAMEVATSSLADLQKKSIAYRDTLIGAGCPDRSLPIIKQHLGEMTDYLREAMDRQVSTKVPRLSKSRLWELESILRDAIDRMQRLRIPDALTHSDMNLGNLLTDGTRCIFIDWAGVGLGNPFLTFQNLCVHIARSETASALWIARMRNLYRQSWREILSETDIDIAFSLMPILAIASCLYGCGEWLTSPHREHEQAQAYRRSLARHLDRAAGSLLLEDVPCH